MSQKTVSLPAVRIEPQYRDALETIAHERRPQTSVSALVRQAVIEYLEANIPQAKPGPTETK